MKHWTKPKDSLGEPPIPLDRGAVRIKRAYMTMAASLALAMLFATPALAASDPLTAINNLSDFVFSAIKAIGAILLGFENEYPKNKTYQLLTTKPGEMEQ